MANNRTITQLPNDSFLVSYPYSEADDIKPKLRSLRGTRWDNGKNEHGVRDHQSGWVVPNEHMVALADIAVEYDFDAPCLAGELHPRWVGHTSDGDFYLQFPYDVEIVGQLKADVNGARWNKVNRTWVIPKSSRDALSTFASAHGFVMTDRVRTLEKAENNEEAPLKLVPDSEFSSLF